MIQKYARKELFRDGEGQEEQEASTNARLQDHHYILPCASSFV